MVKKGTRANDKFFCVICGHGKEFGEQSIRYYTKDAKVFQLNCGNCNNKIIVIRMNEGVF